MGGDGDTVYWALKSDWNCEQAQLNLLRSWSVEDRCSHSAQASKLG